MDTLPKDDNKSNVTSNLVHSPAPKKSVSNQLIMILIISTVGIAAAFGTFFLINQLQQRQDDLSQVDESLAWRPNVTGTCTSANIKLGPEDDPFDVKLDLTYKGQTQTLNFSSSGSQNTLNENFNWPFTGLSSGDTITWKALVTWNNGNNRENHNGSVVINNCAQATATPAATPTTAPSATATTKPSATATVRPSATATATAVPTATATTVPTGTPPIGGPSSTPTTVPTATPQTTLPPAPSGDGLSDGQGCAQNDCSGNKVADSKSVADATKLPDAGIPGGVYALIAGGLFLGSGFLLGKQKKY